MAVARPISERPTENPAQGVAFKRDNDPPGSFAIRDRAGEFVEDRNNASILSRA